jgi:hypothetical protein
MGKVGRLGLFRQIVRQQSLRLDDQRICARNRRLRSGGSVVQGRSLIHGIPPSIASVTTSIAVTIIHSTEPLC